MSEPNKHNESDDEQKDARNPVTSSDFGPDRHRRSRREPPPLDLLQRTLARCMAQIIVNMTQPEYQRACLALLQITELDDVQHRLLHIIQEFEAKREQRRHNKQ